MRHWKWSQFVAAFVASFSSFICGLSLGWTAPTAEELRNATQGDYSFSVTNEEFSWVGSSLAIGAVMSCVPFGYLMDIIGRKWSLMFLVCPALIGWGFIIGSISLWMMIIGRIFLGISLGAFYVIAPVYIAEISTKELRGALGSLFQVNMALGLLFVYTLGAYLDVFLLSVVCGVTPLIFGALFFWMPESPTYLIKKNKKEKAVQALKWLRGNSYNIEREYSEIQQEQEERLVQDRENSLRQALKRPESIKSLTIVIGMSVFQQFCGINAVTFYTTDIFAAAETPIPPDLQTIIIGIMELIMSVASALIVDKWGRRKLLMLSGALMGLCLLSLGTYFYVQINFSEDNVRGFHWLPITSLSIYIIAYAVGFGPVVFLVRSEICSTEIKAFAVSISLTLTWIFAFFITKFFANMVQVFQIGPTFIIYGVISLLGVIFVYFVLPETRKKSMLEIQQNLAK